MTSNTFILRLIKNGFSIPFCQPVYQSVTPRNKFTSAENYDMSIAIEHLLGLGAISKCQPCHDQFISKIFLAPKSNGGQRFILNLKPLNLFIQKLHFKMEDYRTAAKLIPQQGFMATIDLKEAYLLVPISEHDRKYLRFLFTNEYGQEDLYEFTAMPYGLSVAPRTFTKLMREIVTFLRSQGYMSVVYLDDILCIGVNYSECERNITETINLLQCLGFVINFDKSSLLPTQTCRFLGFMYNSTNMTISLPSEKRNNIARLVLKFQSLPVCTIRDFANLIGTLTAACPAVRYGWVYTKQLEREKFIVLQKYGSYDAKFKPSSEILSDLEWWSHNINSTYNNLGTLSFDQVIFTDASLTGWGAVCNNERAHGGWKESEQCFHINYLELLAVFLSLKYFARDKTKSTILLRVDNTTAISYINRMGGIQFPHLNNLTRLIWQWCEERELWLFASYINTKDNKEADEESRRVNPDIELVLSKEAYDVIALNLGTSEIDLFASRTNAKCNLYVSWKQDPDAFAVDAFTLNWKQWRFYAFPPFTLILKCLEKIINDKASGILVFPYWPSQPWFPLLKSMITSRVVFLDPSYALSSSCYRARQQFSSQNTLAAAKLSGSRSLKEEHQKYRLT